MKRFLHHTLVVLLVVSIGLGMVSPGLATTEDYSVAEKFSKQLQAGSGLNGTLTLTVTPVEGREGEAYYTTQPFVFDISYIAVRENAAAGTPAERRYDIHYMDGENIRAITSLSLQEGVLYMSGTLLGDGWYALEQESSGDSLSAVPSPSSGGIGGPDATSTPNLNAGNPLSQSLAQLLSEGALPSLYSFFLPTLLQAQSLNSADLNAAFTVYGTKVDLWIEGYRQNAILGKLNDGTTTMQVDYAISPSAVKAQLKQMVMDLLSDTALLPKLQALLSTEDAALLLNPSMQNFYFFAIDSLPLEGDLAISRTVSLKGDTLALEMRLPLYDKSSGLVEIAYHRTAGEGDLPDENIISLTSENLNLELEYQEYRTMTDVTVYQGKLLREPRSLSRFAVDEEDAKTLSAAFTLTHKTASGVDDQDRETLSDEYQLHLEPFLATVDDDDKETPLTPEQQKDYYAFPAFDLDISSVYASKQAKNAPTSMELHITLASEELPQTIDVSFSGRSVEKWTPAPIDLRGVTKLSAMTGDDFNAFLGGVVLRAGACFLPFMRVPKPKPSPALSESPPATGDGAPATAAP